MPTPVHYLEYGAQQPIPSVAARGCQFLSNRWIDYLHEAGPALQPIRGILDRFLLPTIRLAQYLKKTPYAGMHLPNSSKLVCEFASGGREALRSESPLRVESK